MFCAILYDRVTNKFSIEPEVLSLDQWADVIREIDDPDLKFCLVPAKMISKLNFFSDASP